MNQAKKAAARSWRSTLSSGGEGQEKEELEKKAPPQKEKTPDPPQVVGEQQRRDPWLPADMEDVQQKALEAKQVTPAADSGGLKFNDSGFCFSLM